jgi:rhodanese-related sulfurtransferase
VQGYLQGGFEAWQNASEPIDLIIDIEADELAMDMPHDDLLEVIDVRKPGEFEAGHVQGAINVPLDTMADPANIAMIDDEHNLYIHCAGGYRSVIAASLLKREGYHNLRNILGGYAKIKGEKGIKIAHPDKAKA